MKIKHLFIITNINKHFYIGGYKFIATNYHLYFRQIYLVCYHSWHVIGAPIGCWRWCHGWCHYSPTLPIGRRWWRHSLWLAGAHSRPPLARRCDVTLTKARDWSMRDWSMGVEWLTNFDKLVSSAAGVGGIGAVNAKLSSILINIPNDINSRGQHYICK